MSNEDRVRQLELADKFQEDVGKLILKAAEDELSPDSVCAILVIAGFKVSSANTLSRLAAQAIDLQKEKKSHDVLMKPTKMPKGGWQ